MSSDMATAVVPGIYVGPYLYAKSSGWLARHNITHIVNATPSVPCAHEHITYFRVAIDDQSAAPIGDHFEACRAFISTAISAGGVVLVHCHMGRSRSVTLVAAYLMAERGIDWRAALEMVKVARPSAGPNAGFLRALRVYEDALRNGPTMPCTDTAAAQCSCEEMAHLRGLRCAVCAEEEPEQPQPASSRPHRPRHDAFLELLDADPHLSVLAFVPGPLHEGLFDGDDASEGVRTAPLPPIEVGLISAAHHMAIDLKALPGLFAEVSAAWRDARACWPPAATTSTDESAESAAAARSLERSTRALLLLSLGQNYTAWADRRRLLLRQRDSHRRAVKFRAGLAKDGGLWKDVLEKELAFSALVLRSFTKSHESFGYRRWLLGLCVRAESGLGLSWFVKEQAADEAALCEGAMAKRRANYHAARHVNEAVLQRLSEATQRLVKAEPTLAAAAGDALRAQLQRTRSAAVRAPSDPSVLHARRAALEAAAAAQPSSAASDLEDERRWLADQLARSPWYEVLWLHKRWILSRAEGEDGTTLKEEEEKRRVTAAGATDEQRAAAERWAVRDAEWRARVRRAVEVE